MRCKLVKKMFKLLCLISLFMLLLSVAQNMCIGLHFKITSVDGCIVLAFRFSTACIIIIYFCFTFTAVSLLFYRYAPAKNTVAVIHNNNNNQIWFWKAISCVHYILYFAKWQRDVKEERKSRHIISMQIAIVCSSIIPMNTHASHVFIGIMSR